MLLQLQICPLGGSACYETIYEYIIYGKKCILLFYVLVSLSLDHDIV